MFSTLQVSFAQNVTIPDANFKAALLSDAIINTVDDGEISIAEAEAFTGTINVSGEGIADITGVEAFINITGLTISNNSITSLDLSNNTGLFNVNALNNDIATVNLTGLDKVTYLNLSNNELDAVDISDMTDLLSLFISNNNLSSLDVSNNTKLTLLQPAQNNLSSIDLSALVDLETLQIQVNDLSTIDLSNNTKLRGLNVENNNLTSLDLSNNPDIIQVLVPINPIVSLDLSSFSGIIQVDVRNCPELTTLNVKNGNNTNVNSFRATNTPKLTCIVVDDVTYSETNWTEIDAEDEFVADANGCQCLVEIPDANFKAALVANDAIDTDMDDEISCEEAEAFDGTIDVTGLSIADFTGLEAFVNLDIFKGGGNTATSIDVSANTALTRLEIYNLPLSSLDVSNNVNLDYLQFGKNTTFSSIDLSNNTLLRILSCPNTPAFTTILGTEALVNVDYFYIQGCSIESLDLSKCVELNQLRAQNNNLSYLNVRNGINEFINLFEIQNNPNLTCVSVDDPAYSEANWTNKDVTAEYKLFCDPNELVLIPDANFKAALVADDNIDTNMDDEISFGEAEAFTGTIDVGGLNISDITGLEAFINLTGFAAVTNQITTIDLTALTKLETLNLNNNSLSSIDVSNNTALTFLALTNNNLSSIDVSLNTALTVMSVSQNNITTLDVSMLTELIELYARSNSIETLDLTNNSSLRRIVVYSNALTTLNVKNGNNSNVIAFSAHTNPSLNCITVDDVSFSETNWTQIDDGVIFSTDCSLGNSVSSIDVLERNLYPNPSSSDLYIETQINSSYKVMNLFGQEVLHGELNAGTNQINVQTLEDGVYYLVPEGAKTYRFVKH